MNTITSSTPVIPTELLPTEHLLVYDLLQEAGMDVSDWTQHEHQKSPASDLKYCYNWTFTDGDKIVICLWHQELDVDDVGVFQRLNYRDASARKNNGPRQKKRALKMDLAIQKASSERLPIRVIIVDGSRRGKGKEPSKVKRRLLDSEPWHVAEYDDDGNCRIQRGLWKWKNAMAINSDSRLARIAYNKLNWQRPSGDAGGLESSETFNTQNKFGYEDWLFRAEWQIDGWRYAFIQGLNKSRKSHIGTPLDITLFTIQPDKKRRLVATIYEAEA